MKQIIAVVVLVTLCTLSVAAGEKPGTKKMPALPALRIHASEAEEMRPEIVARCIKAGYVAIERGDYIKAMNMFERARILEPNNRDGRFGISTVYVKMGNNAAALRLWKDLLKESPDDYSILNNVAWLYATIEDEDIRDPDAAVLLAREALLHSPKDVHVWSTLSAAYYATGSYEKALHAANEALYLGRERKFDASKLKAYREQAEDCQAALTAFSLLQ